MFLIKSFLVIFIILINQSVSAQSIGNSEFYDSLRENPIILDGIKNKIDPGKSFDDDLYSLSEDQVEKLPTVCGSLREAMQSLDKDRKFLTEGGVFTDDQIDAYIELKFQEIYKFEHTPHPIEFEMYYSD